MRKLSSIIHQIGGLWGKYSAEGIEQPMSKLPPTEEECPGATYPIKSEKPLQCLNAFGEFIEPLFLKPSPQLDEN
jgi:hypothetical protein